MHRLFARLTLFAALALVAPALQAQPAGRAFSLFLDCRDLYCEPDFYRQEISFTDHVRDRTAADVHLLVTQQQTGGGGNAYTLAFYGQRKFDGVSDTLTLVVPQGSTEDERRRALVRRIRLGLARYLARTPEAEQAAVTLASSGSTATPRAARDRWNAWVFQTEAQVYLERERSSSETELDFDVRADRITERWKTRMRIGEDYNDESFNIDGERVTSVRRNFSGSLLQVRSLGRHWSAGIRLGAGSSTFRNQRLGVVISPAVEYDLYPYAEATRRQLYIQYAVGGRFFRYEDTTVYFKTRETLPFESLHLSYMQKQTWGSLQAQVAGYHFLHDLGKSRLNFNAGANVRIVKGLAFQFSGRYAVIHDQLYLPKGDLTREEVLLRQTQLATGYQASVFAGLSYTFGSVFNNIVNPRFSIGNDF
ncbi:MAG TPA: hypothetical protein VFS59_06795 [Gemmatimonadaceae bacterium]|nr:hypothetical protein [Gemmatimonadaceae bacterium]